MEENEIVLSSVNKDYSQEIAEIIKGGFSNEEIKEKLENYHDNDLADALELFTKDERIRLYKILGDEKVSEIFAYSDNVEEYISELSSEKAADIIEEMDADDAIDVLEELEEDKAEELFKLLDEEVQSDIGLIQSYDEDSVGSKMTTNFIAIKKDYTIKQAMKALVDQAAENDNVSTIYVVEEDGTYCGAVELRELIIARAGTNLQDIIITSYPFLHAEDKVDRVLEDVKEYAEDSIPVLDADKKLIGVITSSDIVEVVDEQADEDIANFAGIAGVEDLNEPLKQSLKKRTPWLLVLLFLGIVVSTVTGLFDSIIEVVPFIVCFQTLILGMAGNTGTQSVAITIRILDTEELTFTDKLKYFFKELRVGICNGLIMGALSFLVIGFFVMFKNNFTVANAFATSGCISLALILAMLISSCMGVLIPMFFKKIKVDPAVASGPLITTINDLVAVVTYYGFAWLFLIKIFALV